MLALREKLRSADSSEQEYVFRFFSHSLSELEPTPSSWTVDVITKGLKAGDRRFHDLVKRFANPTFGDAEWFDPFKQDYDTFQERSNLGSIGGITDDDVPF